MRNVRLRPAPGGRGRLLRRPPASPEPVVKRPGLVAASGLVALCVSAGLYWPSAGDGLARLLVVSLAGGFIAFRAYRALPPVRVYPDSPFGREAASADPAAVPLPLARLTRAVGGAGRKAAPGAEPIPARVAEALREEAARRLREDHRLELTDGSDHPRIRALIAEPTWLLLRPPEAPAGPAAVARRAPSTLTLAQLDLILDDLERL